MPPLLGKSDAVNVVSRTASRQACSCRWVRGDCRIADIVSELQAVNYGGWYVIEQDAILDEQPEGEGPVGDVRTSVNFLQSL